MVKLSLPNYGDFELIFSQIQQFITICSKEQIQRAGDKCTYPPSLPRNVIFNFAGCSGSMLTFMWIIFSCSLVPLYNPVFGGPQAGETRCNKKSCEYGHCGFILGIKWANIMSLYTERNAEHYGVWALINSLTWPVTSQCNLQVLEAVELKTWLCQCANETENFAFCVKTIKIRRKKIPKAICWQEINCIPRKKVRLTTHVVLKAGLKITAGHWTMSDQDDYLSGQKLSLTVILTGHVHGFYVIN